MSKSKAAKTAIKSKNNPNARGSAREYKYEDKKVRPVKIISDGSTFFATEDDTGNLILSENGQLLKWSTAVAIMESRGDLI